MKEHLPALSDVPFVGELLGSGNEWLSDQLSALGGSLECILGTCLAGLDTCITAAGKISTTLQSSEMQELLAISPYECVQCFSTCGSLVEEESPEACGVCFRSGMCKMCDPTIKVTACGILEAEDFGFGNETSRLLALTGNSTMPPTFAELLADPERAQQYVDEWFAAIGPQFSSVMALSVRPSDLNSVNATEMEEDAQESFNPCARCVAKCTVGEPDTGETCSDCYNETPECVGCEYLGDRYCEGNALLSVVDDMARAVAQANISDPAGKMMSNTFLCANCLLTCLRNSLSDEQCYQCFGAQSQCDACQDIIPEHLLHPCAIRKLIYSIQESMRWSCVCYQNVQKCFGGESCSPFTFAEVVDDCPEDCGIMCRMKDDFFDEQYLTDMLADQLNEDQMATMLGGGPATPQLAPPEGEARIPCIMSEDFVIGRCSARCAGAEGLQKIGRIIEQYPYGPGASCPPVEFGKCQGTVDCDPKGTDTYGVNRCHNTVLDEDIETDVDCK